MCAAAEIDVGAQIDPVERLDFGERLDPVERHPGDKGFSVEHTC
jgi:hypothetical protein